MPLPVSPSPQPKRRRIDLSHMQLASLVANLDPDTVDKAASPGTSKDFRAIFDDFEPAFAMVEYLSTPDTTTAYLSEVSPVLKSVVVTRYPLHHICAPFHNEGVLAGRNAPPST